MKSTSGTEKLYLTGADCFILALERHSAPSGGSNNTCRYVLELDGRLDAADFRSWVNQQPALKQLCAFYLYRPSLFGLPQWNKGIPGDIEVNECDSNDVIPQHILNRNLSHTEPKQFVFDIVHRTPAQSALIFSWNHLLLDGQGAAVLLANIFSGNGDMPLTTNEGIKAWSLQDFRDAAKAKEFVTTSSKKPLTDIVNTGSGNPSQQRIEVIELSEAETRQIDKNALLCGAKFGLSSFYLACCARAVASFLAGKNVDTENFWIPVPQSTRKKGGVTPLLGNHLSFQFYRIGKNDISEPGRCVRSINDQLVSQLRDNIPKAYETLLKILKRVPTGLYYQMIKMPQGKSLSGFLFTVAGNHPETFNEVRGLQITNALSFPLNVFPPGLTFAFMRFKGMLKVMILSNEAVFDSGDFDSLKETLRNELMMTKAETH
jgi:diacylglycerol O-acyltransferase